MYLSQHFYKFFLGEFRRAYGETELLRKRKNIKLYLGDRPYDVTRKRIIRKLDWPWFENWCSLWSWTHSLKEDPHFQYLKSMKTWGIEEKDRLHKFKQEMAKNFPTLFAVGMRSAFVVVLLSSCSNLLRFTKL